MTDGMVCGGRYGSWRTVRFMDDGTVRFVDDGTVRFVEAGTVYCTWLMVYSSLLVWVCSI